MRILRAANRWLTADPPGSAGAMIRAATAAIAIVATFAGAIELLELLLSVVRAWLR